LLAGSATRLPRAETLMNIAARDNVSLDWLLGLSQDEGLASEIRQSVEIEEAPGDFDSTLLGKWHAEAVGTKIRYVPAGIPDLLRTGELIDYEAGITMRDPEAQHGEAQYRIDYNRRPETDMEVCMPRHALEIFARGLGVWSGFPAAAPARQPDDMARRLAARHPRPAPCPHDARQRYAVPLPLSGPTR